MHQLLVSSAPVNYTMYPLAVIDSWQPSDREGVIEVIREVFDEYGFTWDEAGYHADLYDVPGAYSEPGHLFFVAREEGRVIGTAAVEFFPTVQGQPGTLVTLDGKVRIAGCDCSLERLYVRRSARRTGVGKALFGAALQGARDRGATAMEIWSDKRFEAAHMLYRSLKAELVGDRVCDDPDESPEWGLRLKIWRVDEAGSVPR